MQLLPGWFENQEYEGLPLYNESLFQNVLFNVFPNVTRSTNARVCDFSFTTTQKMQSSNKDADKEDAFLAVERKSRSAPKTGSLSKPRSQIKPNPSKQYQTVRGGYTQKNYQGGKYSNGGNQNTRYKSRVAITEYSVPIDPEWSLVKDLPTQFLSNTQFDLKQIQISDIAWKGEAYAFKKEYELIGPNTSILLPRRTERMSQVDSVGTRDDEFLCDQIEKDDVDIIISSQILAAIMNAAHSRFGWQIDCYKFGNKLVFDKSETNGNLDLVPLYEAVESLGDTKQKEFAATAARIQQDFWHWAVDMGKKVVSADEPQFDEDIKLNTSRLYRYRSVVLPPGRPVPGHQGDSIRQKRLNVCVRTVIDAAGTDADGTINNYINLHTFNEGLLRTNSTPWSTGLVRQKGQQILSEIRDNNCVFGRWLINAILAGSTRVNLGFISTKDDESKVLTVYCGRTNDLLVQSGLKLSNGWGVFREICDTILADTERNDARYVITRESLAGLIKIHATSIDADPNSQVEEEENVDSDQE